MSTPTDAERWAHQIELVVVPSFACNLRCGHCFVDQDLASAPMSLAQLAALLRDGEALGCYGFQVTGGELFVWKHSTEALPVLAGLSVPVVISTNGTMLQSKHMVALEGSQVSLCISLDGPTSVHDGLRGAGAFATLKAAAALCVQHGLPFDVSSTVTKTSLPALAATVREAVALGARAAYFSPVQQLGGRSEAQRDQRLDDDECLDLLAALTLLREKTPTDFGIYSRNIGMRPTAVKNPCSVFACWGEFCPSKKYWPSQLCVLPDGEVLPQSLHIDRRYSLGNALQSSLGSLVQSYWGGPKHAQFQALCRHVYQDLIYGTDQPFFFWNELIYRASRLPFEAIPAHTTVSHPHDHTEEIEQARRRGQLPVVQFPVVGR